MITIDPYVSQQEDHNAILKYTADFETIMNDNLKRYDNIGKLKFFSNDIYDMFKDEYFDLIYIDGDHSFSGVFSDIQNYYSKLKPGGILSGHDYKHADYLIKVDEAIEELIGTPTVTFSDSSWLVLKDIK